MTLARQVNENHRRSLSITLQLIDQTLCRWDEWAHGRLSAGVMYAERDSISPAQKTRLLGRIATIRGIITRLRDDLQLSPKLVWTSEPMVAQAASLWEMSLDVTSHALQGYGEISPQLRNYLDPIIEHLANEFQAIGRTFSRQNPDQLSVPHP